MRCLPIATRFVYWDLPSAASRLHRWNMGTLEIYRAKSNAYVHAIFDVFDEPELLPEMRTAANKQISAYEGRRGMAMFAFRILRFAVSLPYQVWTIKFEM